MTRSGVEGRDDDMLLGMEKPGRLRFAGNDVDASERVRLENDVDTPE